MLKFSTLLESEEGKIFLFGLMLFLFYVISVISVYLFSVEDANNLIVMTVTNFFFGRAAGISYGYTAKFSDEVIILTNMIIEFVTVMIIYPLFVLSWKRSVRIEMLKSFFTNVKLQRRKYKGFFQKYGKYGLFIFVWFPFWMTGPVVGSIIGYLIGIRHYITMLIVLSGTSLAIVIWTYFLKEIMYMLNQFSSNAPYIILGLIIVITLVLKFMKKRT
ncbi:small multi-drug export protein [Sulfurimonas sp.]|uniref:small multi-drug export protein n=1 Tax=Sulfurimonas sp. TaxID=2022749 RepID=UPI003561A867